MRQPPLPDVQLDDVEVSWGAPDDTRSHRDGSCTDEVSNRFSGCSPADDIAPAHGDFGTSHRQLVIERYTNFPCIRKGPQCPRPTRRQNRAAHLLIPPFRLTNWSRGSESDLYAAAYRRTRDHLLRVRLSALAGSAVHRMIAANGSSRSDTSNRHRRTARRARSSPLPSAAHQETKPYTAIRYA